MKNLRNFLTAITLMAILLIGPTTTNAGILMSDLTEGNTQPQSCTETNDDSTKVDNGILVTFTGILVTYTGILVTFSNDTQVDCGIMVSD